MAPISESVEIERRPEEVLAYPTTSCGTANGRSRSSPVEPQGDQPMGVGKRVRETRAFPGATVDDVRNNGAYDPPRQSAASRVLDGPVRGVGTIVVEPAGGMIALPR